jgi:hypothetical protein
VSLDASWSELSAALKALRESWDEVRECWTDVVRQDFEGLFWAPLEGQVKATLSGLERARPVLLKLRDECG